MRKPTKKTIKIRLDEDNNDEYDILNDVNLTYPISVDKVSKLTDALEENIVGIDSRHATDEVFVTLAILKILYQNKTPPNKKLLSDLSIAFVGTSTCTSYWGYGSSRTYFHNVSFIDKLMECVNAGYSPPLGFIANIYRFRENNIIPYLILFVTDIKLLNLIGITSEHSNDIETMLSNKAIVPSFDISNEEIEEYLLTPTICESIVIRLLDISGVTITERIINNIAVHCSFGALNKVMSMGGKLTTELLESICRSSDSSSTHQLKNNLKCKLIFVLDNKIQPTNKALYILLNNAKPTYSMRNASRSPLINNFDATIGEAVDIFIRYGYELTYDDMLYALSKGVIISNIEHFNFKFDTKYASVCEKIGKCPYVYELSGAICDIAMLTSECQRSGNLDAIRKHMNTKKLIPSERCMEIACGHRSNTPAIKFLISKGGVISLECLREQIEIYGGATLEYLFGEFKKNYIISLKNTAETETKLNDTCSDNTLDDSNIPDDSGCQINDKKSETNIIINSELPLIISNIPLEFMITSNVYAMIPMNIKKLLELTIKHKTITYRDFRSLMIKYLNDNNLIKESKIVLQNQFLHKGADTVELRELNEWVYSLLTCSKTTYNKKASTNDVTNMDSNIIECDTESIKKLTIHDIDNNEESTLRQQKRNIISKKRVIVKSTKDTIKSTDTIKSIDKINTKVVINPKVMKIIKKKTIADKNIDIPCTDEDETSESEPDTVLQTKPIRPAQIPAHQSNKVVKTVKVVKNK